MSPTPMPYANLCTVCGLSSRKVNREAPAGDSLPGHPPKAGAKYPTSALGVLSPWTLVITMGRSQLPRCFEGSLDEPSVMQFHKILLAL